MKYASAKHGISVCDRCGFQFKLKELKELIVKTKRTNLFVCQECWEPDHPQNMLGMYPVDDPQAVMNPRPDTSYAQSRSITVVLYSGAGCSCEVGKVAVIAA